MMQSSFPVVDKIENPLLKNLGVKRKILRLKIGGDKTLLAFQGCETLFRVFFFFALRLREVT